MIDLDFSKTYEEDGNTFVTSTTVEEVAKAFKIDLTKDKPCAKCKVNCVYDRVAIIPSEGMIGLVSKEHGCGKKFNRSVWVHYDHDKGKEFANLCGGLFDAMKESDEDTFHTEGEL